MREGFFVTFVLLLALVIIGASYWFILQRAARFMGVSFTQAFDNLFRPDLDKAKLTHGTVNLIYRHLMRSSGKKGPNGDVLPVSMLEVRMPPDDFHFIQHNGGIPDFTRQLAGYRHALAVKKGWVDPGIDAAEVRITRDTALKRLRPHLTPVYGNKGSETRRLSGHGSRAETAPVNASRARVRYGTRTWSLESSRSPYSVGRTVENTIQINHEQVSARHAEIRYETDGWTLVPLRTLNTTKVNGSSISSNTRLHNDDVITVGDSGPVIFSLTRVEE